MDEFTSDEEALLKSKGFVLDYHAKTFYRDFSEISDELTKRNGVFYLREYSYDHDAGDYKPSATSSSNLTILLNRFERF
jgi:hypothetical protein